MSYQYYYYCPYYKLFFTTKSRLEDRNVNYLGYKRYDHHNRILESYIIDKEDFKLCYGKDISIHNFAVRINL